MARTPNLNYRKNILKSILENDNSGTVRFISSRTGISAPSIGNHIKACLEIGLVEHNGLEKENSGRGRRSNTYSLTQLGMVCLSFDDECANLIQMEEQSPVATSIENETPKAELKKEVAVTTPTVTKTLIDSDDDSDNEDEEDVEIKSDDSEFDIDLEEDEDDYDFDSDFVKYKNSSFNFYEENNYKIKDEFDDGEYTKDLSDIFSGEDW